MNNPIQPEDTTASDTAALFTAARETLADIRSDLDSLAARIESEQGAAA